MKKHSITLFIISALLVFSLVPSISATENSCDSMIEQLVSYGLNRELFYGMAEVDICAIYNELADKKIVFLGSDTFYLSDTLMQAHNGQAETLGTIPESDLKFTVTKLANVTYDSPLGCDKINKMYVYIDYIWSEGDPLVARTDGITVNWDSSVFTFESNSFVSKDYKRVMSQNWDWKQTNETHAPASLNTGGLGYYVPLVYGEPNAGGIQVAPKQHKGTAYFTLLPTRNPMYLKSGSMTTSINAVYLHNQNIGLGSSVSFSYKGLGVSVSVPMLSNSLSASTNVFYALN